MRRRFLFLLDDGWLQEKQDLIAYLHERIDLRVATHRSLTAEKLAVYQPQKLEKNPLPKSAAYTWNMFWARELDTYVVKRRRRLTWAQRPLHQRALQRVREGLGAFGLRRKSYADQLEKLYAGSSTYRDLLDEVDYLVYNPVTVQDKRLLFECLAHPTCQLISWVYSWDNPFKDNEFISNADHYIVWNEQGIKDLEALHGVPPHKVHKSGPVQFEYLLKPIEPAETPSVRNVLYTCSMAVDLYVRQEVELILRYAAMLQEIDPQVVLRVRPYPFRHADLRTLYHPIRALENVEVLEYGELNGTVRITRAEELLDKRRQFEAASAVINLGSTIGLEASFTSTPVLQVLPETNAQAENDLAEVFRNEHLRHLLHEDLPNVIHSEAEMRTALEQILSGNVQPYEEYTKRLQTFLHVKGQKGPFEQFHACLQEIAGTS